jgi:Protein of unknown function (DUF2865)
MSSPSSIATVYCTLAHSPKTWGRGFSTECRSDCACPTGTSGLLHPGPRPSCPVLMVWQAQQNSEGRPGRTTRRWLLVLGPKDTPVLGIAIRSDPYSQCWGWSDGYRRNSSSPALMLLCLGLGLERFGVELNGTIGRELDVRFVPEAAVSKCIKVRVQSGLLDHLIGGHKKPRWHRKAKRLRGREVERRLHFPVEQIVNGTPAETCRAICPYGKTEVFVGSEIGAAVAQDGQRYTALDTAFLYREQLGPIAPATAATRSA